MELLHENSQLVMSENCEYRSAWSTSSTTSSISSWSTASRTASNAPVSAQRRRALSEATGMQVECEASGFRSSSSSAQEHLSHRTFDSAGRRRATLLSIFMPLCEKQQSAIDMAAPPIARRAYTVLPTFASPSAPNRIFNRSYDSPAESAFASIARTLAMAFSPRPPVPTQSLRTSQLLNMESSVASPWPTSAFSDYSSSECSTRACSPWEDSEDPFEFDNTTSGNTRPLETSDSYFPAQPEPDDYEQFAAAIRTNPMNYTFVLPSFPPKRLLERRPAFATQNTTTPSATTGDDPKPTTLATRRRRPAIKPLGLRAHSYTESPQPPQPLPVRRTNSLGDHPSGTIDPPIPSLQSEAPASITRSSNSRLSQLFSAQQSLLPPPSPPTSGEDEALYGHIHHQISPPQTPVMAVPGGGEREREEDSKVVGLRRIPPPPMSISLPPNGEFGVAFGGVSALGLDSGDAYAKRDMFPFDEILGQMI